MKKILKLVSKAAVITLMLSLSSCYYDEIVEEIPPEIPEDVVVSFETDIQPIFTASCASCHPTIAPPDLTVGNSYNSIINDGYIVKGDPDASILYQTLITTNAQELMPPNNPLPNSEINKIKTWIERGALDN
jgi:hypothetical protein